MNEDKRSHPSPKRPRWSRRLFTADSEEASRTSRAATASVSSCSSIRPVLLDGTPDEDPTATNAAEPVGRPNSQATRQQDSRPLFDEAQSLLARNMSFEQGFEDLGRYDDDDDDDDDAESRPKISATFRDLSATPRLQYPLPGLAADMGDSPCLVALTSQQRHYKTSTHPLLQARDSKFLGSRSQEGGTSQARAGAPELQGDPAVPDGPSVEVILGREIKPIDRQHLSRSRAMPGLGRQKKSSTPFSELDAAERASPSVASTSTRKPPAAGAKVEAAPAAERQSLKIDISFGKAAGVDKDGTLLKSISTNVEKIVARLLTRHAEDRRPLSRVDDTETAVIGLDSQRCVSVDVTMADDAGERRQQTPAYPAAPASQATSKDRLHATPNDATTTPAGTSTGGEPAERRRHDGPRKPPTPTSVVHLTIGPISFGHSQPAIQQISQPESVQKVKRGKASSGKLSTARTPTDMPSETAAFRALEKSLTPAAAGSGSEQAKPPEGKHLPLAPTSTDKLLKKPKKKHLPPALASPGKPLKPAKEPQFSSETGSILDTQMKPAKERDVTRLRAVDKDHAAKRDAESIRKLGPASAKRSSEESLPSVHEMSGINVSEKIQRRPAATGSTKTRRPSAKMSMSKDGAPSAPVQGATKESEVLSPETGEMLPRRKKSIGDKKAPTQPAKEIPVKLPVSPKIPEKSPVSPEETELQQKTKQARPIHKTDAESKLSSPDKGKLPSGRKKSVTEKHPPTAPAKHGLVKSPVSPEETVLQEKTKHAKPVDETLRESQVSSPESGKQASRRKKSPRRKKSTAGQKPATAASAKDTLKRASVSPEETFLKAAATSSPGDKEAVTSDDVKKLSPTKEKDLTAAPAALEVSGKPTTTEDAHKPEQVVPKEASEEKGPLPEHADERPIKPAGHEKESPKEKRKKSLKTSAKDGDQESKTTTTSEKRKKSLKSPDKAGIGIEKSPKEPSQVEPKLKPSEADVPISTEDKKVSSDELPAEKDKRESAPPEGTKSRKASAHTTLKTSGTEKATKKPDKAARKASAHGDRESTKMLAEELGSIKSDQPGEQQTLTQDTSLHSILKRHHDSKGSKKAEKAKKDADGEAAEKHSKALEDTKSSAGAERRASRHKDVSSKEPEVSEKGLTAGKEPSKVIAAEEDKASTKQEAKLEGGSHELDRPTTTKTVESETGEPVSKSSRKRKSLAIDARASEQKDPDAVAIERARKQSLVRTEHSQLDEKDLDDFLIGFELALDPYRVLVGLKPATSSQDEEGASKKGSKRSKDRKPVKKDRRTSIVRIHKSDIERKKKKGDSGVESPSPLALLAPESAVGEQTADTDRKGKRKKRKSKYASSKSARARKSGTTAEETGAGATAATESPTTRDSRRQTSATSRGAREGKEASRARYDEFQRGSQPALKERLPADEAGGLPVDRQFLEDEEEDEARRKKKEKKKRKKEGGKKRKPKKRKRKRKKRNRPIGYRSGRPTCQILCPVAVGLLFALIVLFLLLRALATASTATLPATTTYMTFTYPTPRSTTAASPAVPPIPPPAVPTKPPPVPPAKTPPKTSTMPPIVSPILPPPPPVSNVYVCPTEVCRREAAYLANLLNTIDSKPCENLLAYVCDGWSRENPAGPEGVGSFVSRGTMIQDALAQELLDVIRSAPDEDLKVAAALHASCTARPASDSALAFAQNMFRTWVIKAWPRNASATAQASDVWQFAAEVFRDLGISALLEVTVGVSPKGMRQAVVELDRPQLLFYRSDESSAEVDAMLRGAVEEALTVFTQSSSPEIVDQTKGMFVELARLPNDGQPEISGMPERWILVEFSKLDDGLQNFLGKLFDNIFHPGAEPDVVLKSPTYVREGLVHFVSKADPVQALNYVGFLVVVRLAPFLPDRMTYVRGLFAKSMLGRSFRDVTDSSKLCLLAVESLLPNCFAKAAAILRKRIDADLGLRDVFSRLKALFGREIQHLEWLGELSTLFVRYNLRKNRVIHFGPRPGSCVRWQGNAQDSALKRYFEMSLMRQQEKLQAVLNYSAAANALAFESELDTEVRYDPTRRVVHVPAAIMNASTRTNDSFFALHLPRVATRLYRAMVKMLTEEEPYGGLHTLVPGLTENSTQALGSLLGCIQNNLEIGPGIYPFTKALRKAVLEEAVAIHLAFRAFREMLHVRRIWNLDYRLPNLNFSADQLFFLFFALDNCYTADSVYRRRQPRAAEDFYRVYLPLRYLQEFSDAFQCNRQPVCKIVR